MTPEHARRWLPFIQAVADGKELQFKSREGIWISNGEQDIDGDWEYRIKPEPPKPTTRPWTMADVPPVCWLRCEGAGSPCRLVAIMTKEGVFTGGSLDRWNYLATECEWSCDLKTWRPCTVEVTP
jgi:hypothetical protein